MLLIAAKTKTMPEQSIARVRSAGRLPSGTAGAGAAHQAAAEYSGNPAAWLPTHGNRVFLVTDSGPLQDEIGRVAAAAAVGLTVISTVEEAGDEWDAAAAVLVGIDVTSGIRRRRGPTLLVGFSAEREQLWRQASLSGADRVAALPEAAEWLAEFLSQLRDPAAEGFVLGVIGGCGGAGASTLAVLVAACAARDGIRTLLVDGDEWGGGLDIAVAADEPAGLRWPDLLAALGTINPDQLAASLPVVAGFSLLSWGRRMPDSAPDFAAGATGAQVLRSARRGYELAVVDVGRSRDALSALGQHCDQLLLVLPAQLRSAVASARLLNDLPSLPTALVVRAPLREGLDTELIADSVGCAVLGIMPFLRSAAAAAERGQLTELAKSRPVRRLSDRILAGLRGGPG